MRIGFDNDKYIELQSERIRKRIAEFGGKLYLEFGGKLFDDYHASRVLPGFAPDSKMRMLRSFGSQVEIIIVINANDIEKNKRRGDLGISYDDDVLRLTDAFHGAGLYVGSVVIGLSLRLEKYLVRRRLRPQRRYRNHAPAGGRDRAGPRQRKNGHLPEPAVPRLSPRHCVRLRQV